MNTHTATRHALIADAADIYQTNAAHTYGGGLQPPGTPITTYCGLTTTAQGISYPHPPTNPCPLCHLAWQTNKTQP